MAIETWEVPFEAYTGDRPYIFVSYAHLDHEIVFDDLLELHRTGFRLWYDEGIEPGKEFAEELARALHACEIFLVFVSDNAIASRHVWDEINFALEHDKRFLPVHLAPTELPLAWQLRISAIQAILRYRMASDMYYRKLEKALDGSAVGRIGRGPSVREGRGKKPDGGEQTTPPEPAQAGELFRRVAQLHRGGEWAEIAAVGREATEALVGLLDGGPNDVHTASSLIDLSAYLTDANVEVTARRCLDAAIDTLLESLHERGERLDTFDLLGMAYNNLGRLLRKQGPSSRSAESFYRKSLEIFEKLYPDISDDIDLGDRLGMAFTNLGNSLLAQGKPLASEEAFRGAVETYKRILIDYPGDERIQGRLVEAEANLDASRRRQSVGPPPSG